MTLLRPTIPPPPAVASPPAHKPFSSKSLATTHTATTRDHRLRDEAMRLLGDTYDIYDPQEPHEDGAQHPHHAILSPIKDRDRLPTTLGDHPHRGLLHTQDVHEGIDRDLEHGRSSGPRQSSLLGGNRSGLLHHGTAGGGDVDDSGSDRWSTASKQKRLSITTSRASTTTRNNEGDHGHVPGLGVKEKIGVLAVIVHLCKGNIGPGAMSLPNGFSKTGIYAAPFYFVLVALVSTYNMDLLLYCKRVVSPTKNRSFGDVAGKILGPKGKVLIDVFLVGTQLGICCVYFTFIATNIHVVLPQKLQDVLHERQLIFAIYPIILLLSWIRTLNRITPFSSLANIAVFMGIAIVFYYSIDYANNPSKPRLEPVHVDVSQFPEFYGTAVYSFEGIGLILPIQNEMQHPHLFPRVLALCMLAILVLFLFIGEVPTIAFGRITNGSMTAVLHEYCEGWLVTMANVLLAFACMLSFPIQFYPAVEVLERTLNKRGSLLRPNRDPDARRESIRALENSQHRRASGTTSVLSRTLPLSTNGSISTVNRGQDQNGTTPSSSDAGLPSWMERLFCRMSQYECNRTIFRSMLCTILMVIAVCIPDVGLLISLFGAVGSSMLAIIVPPILYLTLEKGNLPLISKIGHWTIVIFGVLGMVAGTIQAMSQVVSSFA